LASAVIARMNAHDIAKEPFQHIDMMAGLVRKHAAIMGPAAAPVILTIIGLVAAPAHADGAEDEPGRSGRLPTDIALANSELYAPVD
jgi:hypothetical protein